MQNERAPYCDRQSVSPKFSKFEDFDPSKIFRQHLLKKTHFIKNKMYEKNTPEYRLNVHR